MATSKSAIKECRDQLFLDRAVGNYLSRVGSNLGMDRPQLGFRNDSLWRAVVRRGAVDYLQIPNLFHDWLDVILGPKVTQTSVLSEDAAQYDDFIMVADPTRLPRRGTVVIDDGLTVFAEIEYTFIDPITGKMELVEQLSNDFVANVSNADGTLLANALIGATSLTLRPSEITSFPTSGFPMSLLLDAGTANEEVVQLTGHSTADGPLTVSAVTKNHYGPTATPTNSRLQRIESGGTVIVISDSAAFPVSGMIRLVDAGYGSSEIVEYYDNDAELGLLYLRTKLTGTYTTGGVTPVTLLDPGSKVQLAQLQVKGTEWGVFQTESRKIYIYIPRALTLDRLIDASFLHGNHSSPPTDSVGTSAIAGDQILKLDDASTFPMAGVIVINSGNPTEEHCGYSRIDRFATVMYALPGGGIPASTTVLKVEDARVIREAADLTHNLILGRGTVNEEVVAWTSINLATNAVTLAAGTANSHVALDTCEVEDPNWLYLNVPLIDPHTAGETVALEFTNYGGTDLEIGDPTVSPADDIRFRGHHVFDPGSSARVSAATTLSENLAGPTYLVIDQKAGHTSLEVNDGIMLESTGQFKITIGRRQGVEETIETSGVTTFASVVAASITLTAGASIGDTSISVSSAVALPQPSGGTPYGYRILLDPYDVSGNREYVLVQRISGSTVYLSLPLTKNHLLGEAVFLASDVISLSDQLAYDHLGWAKRVGDNLDPLYFRSQSAAHLIEELRTYIKVGSLTGLPLTDGKVILNFGNGSVRAENRTDGVLAPGDTSVVLRDSALFPASDFMIEIGDGINRERKHVTTNTYGSDTLTLDVGVNYDHADGTQVRYVPGDQSDVEYTSVAASPNRLVFEDGVYLPEAYQKNVSVSLRGGESEPSDYGTDYPFLLPAGWDSQLDFLFDWGRAAGVEVEIIPEK